MNRYFLTTIILLSSICFINNNSFACDPIVINIYYETYYIKAGYFNQDIEAEVVSGGPAEAWDWNIDSGLDYDEIVMYDESSSVIEIGSYYPGKYEVSVTAEAAGTNPDEDQCDVYIIDVDLSCYEEYIAVDGDRAEISLSIEPFSDLEDGTVILEIDGSDKIEIWDSETGGSEVTQLEWDLSNSGEKEDLEDYCSNGLFVQGINASSSLEDVELELSYKDPDGITIDYETINLTVVEVEKIQYKIGSDAYLDCPIPPNSLVVAKGADVTFKAIKNPSSAQWPDGKPVWSGNSGASGTNEEEEVAFDTASSNPTDYKVVQADCGNTEFINVVVVDLSTLVINANRTSNPVESSFPMKPGEHYELGGTFEFDLMLGAWPTPVKLYAELWDKDWENEVIASCAGSSISRVFGTGEHDDGTCQVRFYFDNNTSGDSYTGGIDPKVDSWEFEAQSLTYHYLTFGKSSAVSGTPAISAACSTATELILKKHTADDWRATAKFLPAGLSTIPASTHDPVRLLSDGSGGLDEEDWDHWDDWSYFINYNSAEVIIVDDIFICDINQIYQGPDAKGVSLPNIKYQIFVESYSFSGNILVHELGHSCGLEHNNLNINNVMYETTAGNETLLVQSEVNDFE